MKNLFIIFLLIIVSQIAMGQSPGKNRQLVINGGFGNQNINLFKPADSTAGIKHWLVITFGGAGEVGTTFPIAHAANSIGAYQNSGTATFRFWDAYYARFETGYVIEGQNTGGADLATNMNLVRGILSWAKANLPDMDSTQVYFSGLSLSGGVPLYIAADTVMSKQFAAVIGGSPLQSVTSPNMFSGINVTHTPVRLYDANDDNNGQTSGTLSNVIFYMNGSPTNTYVPQPYAVVLSGTNNPQNSHGGGWYYSMDTSLFQTLHRDSSSFAGHSGRTNVIVTDSGSFPWMLGRARPATPTIPPSCTTNLTPTAGSTIGTSTTATFTWNAASGATSYDVYRGGVLQGNVSVTTYNFTGLTPSTAYSIYVVPKNSVGAATGCSSSATTFTTAANSAPISNAGSNQTIALPTSSVTLNGTGSSDPDGTISTYAWSKTSGPSTFTITSPSASSTTVTGLVQGTYVFTLTVTDNLGATNSSTVTITVNPVGSGAKYTLATISGNITISNTSTTPNLVGGDTLFIPANGSYTSVQYQNLNGLNGNPIHIIWLGVNQLTSPSSFQQPSNFNVSYVKIDNEQYYNWYGHITHSYGMHDITYDHRKVVNPTGSYKNQPFETWDDAFASVSMVFTGSKSQTFYNITYQYSRWEGFADVTPLTFGTNWSTSGETKRSICTDITIAYDTFNHITATYGSTPAAIYGTVFKMVVHHSQFTDVAGVGSSHSSHNEAILWYGSGDAYSNYFAGNYSQAIRAVPVSWNGLPGYVGATVQMRFWNNIIYNQLSYSAFEIGQNNKGNRTSGNGINITRATVVFNTIYRTIRASYNPPGYYYGYICDNVNQDTLDVSNNTIILPENDYVYDPITRNNYSVAIISTTPAFLTNTGNKPFTAWSSTITQDTISYIPSASSTLLDASVGTYSFRTTDYYDNPMNGTADVGAVERQAPVSVPVCASNISPAASSTLGTQTTATLTWGTVATATSYDVYIWTGATPPGSPTANVSGTTYNASGLLSNTLYKWYIVPRNSVGPATGCSANQTTFTTAIDVPSCAVNSSPAAGSTIGTTTTATLTWGTVATATSYDVYLWTGVTPPGSPTANVSTLTYSASGLSASTLYKWYIVPRNAGGPAVGCSANQTNFTTATSAPPSCTTNLTPTAGSTILTQTIATITWNAASGATSYDVYLWTGATPPGSPTASNVSTTTYNATGLVRNTLYKWYVVPKNAAGSASGCSANQTTFTTANNGNKYFYGIHSGNISISATSSSPSLVDGDTLVLTGSAGELSIHDIDAGGGQIVIDCSGLIVTSPSTYHQPEWYNLHFVKVLGLQTFNWSGTIKCVYTINNLTLESCTFVNPLGNYKNSPVMQWDGPSYTTMQFTGSKSQTFYSNTLIKCRFDGYQDTGPLIIGSNWGTAPEINRSIFLDGTLAIDTFKNITNTSTSVAVFGVFGTGFNMEIRNCVFDSMMANTGAAQNIHSEGVLWYGTLKYHDNYQHTSWGQVVRAIPLGWTGLPGYNGNGTSIQIWNNLVVNQLNYSAFELGLNNRGGRSDVNGLVPCKWYTVYNTIYRTVDAIGYFAFVTDVVNVDSGTIEGNLIILPEANRTYDSVGRGYVVATISSAPQQQTVRNNYVAQLWLNSLTVDTVNFIPSLGSPLIGKGTAYSFRTTDYFGNTLPGSNQDIGRSQYSVPIILSNPIRIIRKAIRILH